MKKHLKTALFIAAVIAMGHFIAYKMFHIPQRMELVVIICAFLLYPIIRNPLAGVYAVFILSPFIPFLRRLYYLIYERPKIDPLIMLGDALLIIILVGLYFEFKERREDYKKVSFYIRIILLYVLYLVFRTFVFNDFGSVSEAVPAFKNYGPPVLFFFVGIVYADRMDHLKRLWAITIIIGVISAAYAVKQLYIGYSRAEELWFSSISFTTLFIKGKARPFSFFQAPVTFADYMQLASVGILMVIEWSRVKGKYILAALLPLFFYGALITSVRSNWAGILALYVFWYTLVHVKGGKKRIAVLCGMLAAYFAYDFFNESLGGGLGVDKLLSLITKAGPDREYMDMLVTKRTSALTDPLQEHSFVSRIALWRYIFHMSIEPINMFMGRGLGTLKADSLYFTYLAEFGYPGAVFIIWLLIAFIRKGFYIIDNSKNHDLLVLARGMTVTTITFAIISATGTHIHTFPGDVYFWFFNGVIIMRASMIEKAPAAEAAV